MNSSTIKPIKCTQEGCNALFTKNYKLLIHIRTHTGERPFVCDEPNCSKSYTNNSHLRRHKNVAHHNNKKDVTITCEYENCGLVLANKYSYKKHCNRKHNPDRCYTFICNECGQGFGKKKQLQQHSYVHSGIAPFKCDLCDVSCTTIIAMTKHKKRHKTYKCNCGELFHRWTLLLGHRKRCSSIERKFTCQLCNKTFINRSNFKSHSETHKKKEEKYIYPCPYMDCRRFYFYKNNLITHINWFHKKLNNNQKSCSYPGCNKVLKTKETLKRHLLRHVNVNKKKLRKPRHDKGIPKKCMASILSGKNISLSLNNAIIKSHNKDK